MIRETDHPGSEQIVALALTELAHSLAIKVVAEGVETPGQMSFVRAAGCDVIQGYLICPPLDADGITAWFSRAPPALPKGPRPALPTRHRPSKKKPRST